MPEQRSREERALDALLEGTGRAAPAELQPVASFLGQLHGLTELPPPSPSRELAAILESGFAAPAPSPEPSEGVLRPAPSVWLRRSALALGLSAGLTASLVGAAAASNRLPERALDVWDRVVEQMTPFDVGGPRPERPAPDGNGADERTTDEHVDSGSAGTSPGEAPSDTDGGKGVGEAAEPGASDTEATDTEATDTEDADTEDAERDRSGSDSPPSTEDGAAEVDESRTFESDVPPGSSSAGDDGDGPTPDDEASSEDEAGAVPADVEPADSAPES